MDILRGIVCQAVSLRLYLCVLGLYMACFLLFCVSGCVLVMGLFCFVIGVLRFLIFFMHSVMSLVVSDANNLHRSALFAVFV